MSLHRSENYAIAERISAALDPSTAHGKVTTLAETTPEERAKMLVLYAPPKPKGVTP